MTGAHADAVRVLGAWHAPDEGQERLRSAYLTHLRGHPDALSRSGPPEHLTASCVILSADRDFVLLVHHKKADAWFQPGGHIEAGDPGLRAAAHREATEESGIAGLLLTAEPVDLDHHALPGAFGRCRAHLDVRYAARAPAGAVPVASDESHAARWFRRDDLDSVAEPGLLRLVDAAVRAVGPLTHPADTHPADAHPADAT